MASHAESRVRPPGWLFLVLVVLVVVLYAAREVLIPLALSILFSFLLAPAVRRLEHWRLGRAAATVIVTILFVAVFAGIAWFAGNQAVSLVGKLPEYKENIAAKFQTLRAPPQGNLGKAAKAIKEIQKEIQPEGPDGRKPAPQPEKPPPSSALPANALQLIGKMGVSLLG